MTAAVPRATRCTPPSRVARSVARSRMPPVCTGHVDASAMARTSAAFACAPSRAFIEVHDVDPRGALRDPAPLRDSNGLPSNTVSRA
ncbi:MAG: hypothetical protein U0360_08385 [Dehalococcoidia bacterium]